MTTPLVAAVNAATVRRCVLTDIVEVTLRIAQQLGPMRVLMYRDGKESEVADAIVAGIESRSSIEQMVAAVAAIIGREGN